MNSRFPQAEDLRPEGPRGERPGEHREDQHQGGNRQKPYIGGKHYEQGNGRNYQKHIGDAAQGIIDQTASIAAEHAHREPDDKPDQPRKEANDQRLPHRVHQLIENIPSQSIGTQQVRK